MSDDVTKGWTGEKEYEERVCRVMAALPQLYLWWNRLDPPQSVLIAVATKRQLTDGCLRA